jgi:hypothetical protein
MRYSHTSKLAVVFYTFRLPLDPQIDLVAQLVDSSVPVQDYAYPRHPKTSFFIAA